MLKVRGYKEAYRYSEELLRSVIEDIVDYAIFMLDREGQVVSWNVGAERIFGHAEAEIIGQSLSRLIPDEDGGPERFLRELQMAAERGRAEEEGWHVRKDGSRFWASGVLTAVRDDAGVLQGFSKIARDTSERKAAKERLRQAEERLRLMVEGVKDYAIFMLDLQGHIVTWNSGVESFQRYWGEEASGSHFSCFYTTEDIERGIPEQHLGIAITKGRFECEGWRVRKDGSRFWANVIITALRDEQGHLRSFSQVMRDITERKQAEEQLRHNALYDKLTNVANRALFMDRLRVAIGRAKREKEHLFAALFLDLDHFKVINDGFGHLVGDGLLVAIARRLEAALRPGDTIARFGGDEFTILLEGISEANEAIRIVERLRREMSQPFSISGHEIWTGASIGVALSTGNYEQPEEVLRDADTAMYHAKAGGRARYEVFDKTTHRRAPELLQLETALLGGIEREEFCLYYQPIMVLETNQICGFEALLRWKHPERGLLAPAEFVPFAEESGLIVAIGHWVLREACRQMYVWHKRFPTAPRMSVSVNLCVKQFMQPNLIEEIKCVLTETKLDPQSLKLEITESAVTENTSAAIEVLLHLRALGVELSIDDFGTGYSSLSYPQHLPIRTLKVDRSFVSRMDANGDSEIVQAIVTLAYNLGMQVVAEGVETELQLAQLRKLNCRYGQGFLFSKPVEPEAATTLIQAGVQVGAPV